MAGVQDKNMSEKLSRAHIQVRYVRIYLHLNLVLLFYSLRRRRGNITVAIVDRALTKTEGEKKKHPAKYPSTPREQNKSSRRNNTHARIFYITYYAYRGGGYTFARENARKYFGKLRIRFILPRYRRINVAAFINHAPRVRKSLGRPLLLGVGRGPQDWQDC